MIDHTVQCPYCREWVELELDQENQGEMVQDCEVCCRPWRVSVTQDFAGQTQVRVERS